MVEKIFVWSMVNLVVAVMIMVVAGVSCMYGGSPSIFACHAYLPPVWIVTWIAGSVVTFVLSFVATVWRMM